MNLRNDLCSSVVVGMGHLGNAIYDKHCAFLLLIETNVFILREVFL